MQIILSKVVVKNIPETLLALGYMGSPVINVFLFKVKFKISVILRLKATFEKGEPL